MDLASIIGLIAAFALMIFGITNDKGMGALSSFLDPPSALITFGGSFGAMFASSHIKSFLAGLKSFLLIFKMPKQSEGDTIKSIIELSNLARREGLLALEESANNLEDEFMKKGVMLIVDGTDPELVRAIMETELVGWEDRHKSKIGFWDQVAAMGPAWGMIGTLIGLVNMLQQMDDPSAIGPNMAVALITTLYGSMLANWICAPVSNKLKENNGQEVMLKEGIMIEGLLSIQAGENPRVIEEKLKSFLAPQDRVAQGAGEDGGDAVG